MMSRMGMIKRSLAWQLKRRGITIFAGAVILFGLGYLCARNDAYQWEPAELFSVYLGGSGGIDLMLLLWLFLNLPLRGFLWQLMLGECEKVERIKTLKYQSRSAVIAMVLLTMAVFAAMYCGIGFGLMWLLTGRVSGVHIVLRAVLAAWEALAFVLLVFLLGRACTKLQQAAFPAVLILELVCCMACGAKGGWLRLLPFVQAKSTLQGSYFTDGTALGATTALLAVLAGLTVIVWKREDDGRRSN